jgi:hypothetical protein
MAQRTPAEIRSSIETNRNELALSVANLRGEVQRMTDVRAQIERHSSEIAMGVAAVGLLLGTRMLKRRRRRRRAG